MKHVLKSLVDIIDPDSEVNMESSGLVGGFFGFLLFLLILGAAFGMTHSGIKKAHPQGAPKTLK